MSSTITKLLLFFLVEHSNFNKLVLVVFHLEYLVGYVVPPELLGLKDLRWVECTGPLIKIRGGTRQLRHVQVFDGGGNQEPRRLLRVKRREHEIKAINLTSSAP